MIEHKKFGSAREFLESVKEARLEISRHHERAMELESRCTKMTAGMNGMPGGGGSDAQDLWSALADLRAKELEAERKELEAYEAVEKFIDQIPSRRQRAVLRLRYLSGLGWIKVQMKLYDAGEFYSERQIYRIHDAGLANAEVMWSSVKDGEHEVRA